MAATPLLAVAILAASSVLGPISVAQASKDSKPLKFKTKMVNETITAEAVLDIMIKDYEEGADLHGSLKIGLFGNTVPMTVLNFVSLCNSVKRPTGELKFGGSYCHRLITDMHFQCGDITTGDGNGGISIYGKEFNDENFKVGHSEKGTISMSNKGADTNASQFFIIFRALRNLDGKHVAFGQIIDKASLDFLDKVNETPRVQNTFTPARKIKIVKCEATTLKKPLVITRRGTMLEDTFKTDED